MGNIEFDSCNISEGDLFFFLKGVRDGYEFIEMVFDNGVIVIILEKEIEGYFYFLVFDVFKVF